VDWRGGSDYRFLDENTPEGRYLGIEYILRRPEGDPYFDPVKFPLDHLPPDIESLKEIPAHEQEDLSQELADLEARRSGCTKKPIVRFSVSATSLLPRMV